MIDRIAPTRRPAARAVQRQRWAELGFLHWRIPAEVIQPKLPPRLTVDTFDGSAWIGIVPFTMTGVRPVWAPPIPGISSFHEINVRTYVHRDGQDPGVWFFSLDAASSLAVRIARRFFRLPYHRATMSLVKNGDEGSIVYRSDRRWPPPAPATFRGTYRPEGAVAPAEPGTLEHFLAERYILHTVLPDGALAIGRVHHTPYPLQRAAVTDLDESLMAAAGIARPEGAPLAHFAKEVRVEIFGLERV
jgi:uncharacterized protein YqjF (DUF2071 family)